jgi:serine/threonine-protein kinase
MTPCPSLEQLQRLLADEGSSPEGDAVEAHVEACSSCQQALDELTGAAPGSERTNNDSWDLVKRSLPTPEFLRRLEQSSPDGASSSASSQNGAGGPSSRSHEALVDTASRTSRYERLEEIARGGMGAVFRGRDPVLGRDLAVKVLLDGHQDRPEIRQRFLMEAQVGGQLQHPGIVPVYELGEFPDRRLYITMKLIQGHTLDLLLAEGKRGSDSTPHADDLPRFLAIFEQVCQTVAYAHSRGVVHRDLKPLNIMVGAFGEVQVLDWGLAKRVGDRAREPAPGASAGFCNPALALEAGSLETQAGEVLGTPAYMAPEQAQGHNDLVDERADVFGLGAILCQILTGQPAFAEVGSAEMRERAARGDLADAFARLDACDADRELVQIARDALAPNPADRLRDAGVLAARLTTYRDGVQERLRQAEHERAAAQARAAEERKRRRLTLALAACAVLVVALGGGGAAWLWQRDAARQGELARRVDEDLRQVEAARAKHDWPQAWAALEKAEGWLVDAGAPDLRVRVERVRTELTRVKRDQDMLARLDDARMSAIGAVRADAIQFDWDVADEAYRAAFTWYGVVPERRALDEAVSRLKSSDIRDALICALDDWARLPALKRRQQAGEVPSTAAGLADDNVWRRQVRQAIRKPDRQEAMRLAGMKQAAEQPPTGVLLLADALQAAGLKDEARETLRRGYRRYPGDFWIVMRLGLVCSSSGAPSYVDASRYFTAAVALRPDSVVAHTWLGIALKEQKQLAEAEAEYREILRLRPNSAVAHAGVAMILEAQGKLDDSAVFFREALRLDPGSASTHQGFGYLLRRQGKLPEAIAEFREVVVLDPKSSEAHLNLGSILRESGELSEALAELREAVRLRPSDSWPHYYLGWTLHNRWELPEAAAEFKTAIRLSPTERRPHTLLGDVLMDQRNASEAAAAYQEALRVEANSVEDYHRLGLALRRQGKLVESFAALRRCQDLSSQNSNWRDYSTQAVRRAERLIDLEPRLPSFLKGEAHPVDAAETCALVELCALKNVYTAAHFAAASAKAEDLDSDTRYRAACCAALAACGKGEDAPQDAKERTRLRRNALAWLQVEYAYWARFAAKQKTADRVRVIHELGRWKHDRDLEGVRDAGALARLPEPERQQWQRFWQDVEDLLNRTVPDRQPKD